MRLSKGEQSLPNNKQISHERVDTMKKMTMRTAAMLLSAITLAGAGQALAAVIGDLNNDGAQNVADAVMLTKHLTEGAVLTNAEAADLNGDGVIKPEDDIVGHIENNDMIKHWIYAMGEKSVDISTEGELVVNTLSDRQIAAVETLFHYMVEEEMTYGNRDNAIFKIDHALFMGNMLGGINGLREMESDFGLLPMPKMDESQEHYGEYVSNGWTTAIVVPIISSDPELTGTVIDAMSAFSPDTVRKALYDITLNVKLVRDEESVAALDIILDSKSYDWAVDFSWGSSFQAAYNAVYDRRQNNYVSAATKAYDKQVKTINNLLEKISALG